MELEYPPNIPLNENGLVQLSRKENSIWLKWIKKIDNVNKSPIDFERKRDRRGVVDKPLALYPRVSSSILGSPNMSVE